jgi:hypothetical protein
MQLSLLEFLLGSAGIAAVGALVYQCWRAKQLKGGIWAAGYWWSERDRRLGPG